MKRTKKKRIKRVKLRKPKKNPTVEELIYLAKRAPDRFDLGPKAEIDDMSEAARVKFMAYQQKVVEERESQFSCLENIFALHDAGDPLEKDQIDVLVQLAKVSPLPAIAGQPPGAPRVPAIRINAYCSWRFAYCGSGARSIWQCIHPGNETGNRRASRWPRRPSRWCSRTSRASRSRPRRFSISPRRPLTGCATTSPSIFPMHRS